LCRYSWFLLLKNCGATAIGSQNVQEPGIPFARLSYVSTYLVRQSEQYSPRICFELYWDGHYRISRVTIKGDGNRAGNLTHNQFSFISGMLKKLYFNSSPNGIIRKGLESFIAEITDNTDQTKRYFWLDPDHERPFPDSVSSIVEWLQALKTQDASPVNVPDLSIDPICPQASARPLQPAIGPRVSCR
jgi:hypothetical protein